MGRRLDDLVNLLGSRPFFYSSQPSVADLAIFAMLARVRAGTLAENERAIEERPALVRFMERMEKATGGEGPRLR